MIYFEACCIILQMCKLRFVWENTLSLNNQCILFIWSEEAGELMFCLLLLFSLCFESDIL